ncbi:MAG TPA: amidohydrolase [Bacteroidota bacterium]|nr:amidohydrolase [Bacteroidota bacterium]
MKASSLSLMVCLMSAFSNAQQPDVIFVNGKVWTVDTARPNADAVAVFRDRILAVGSNADIKKMAGDRTAVVDWKGKRVLPGLIDDHTHFMSGGFQLRSIDLRRARNEAEFAELIARRASKYPDRWMTGGDWDHDNWPDGKLPTKELIDGATSSTPVFVSRYDGHMALANTRVLILAGITRETKDPPGGTIVRDAKTGDPTGILKDGAMDLVYRVMPGPSEEEMLEAARLALAEARRCGLTGIQDISSVEDFRIYQKLRAAGELTVRVYARLPVAENEHLIRTGIRIPFGDDWIRIGSLKAFADGSLGSSTALFCQPFASDPTTHGLATDIVQDGRLEKWAFDIDKAGLQISIHAIGDSANELMLNMFEKIVRSNPPRDRRFRIEHAQHVRPQDFDRFARLGVIASAQPYHAIDDGRWAEKRIGHDRCKTSYAFRTFIDRHVKLCFGSDWTVAPLNPISGIYAAVTRRTTDGANPDGWFPEQKISVREAIECYTINNAYAAYEENDKGSITPGKLADFTVLSDDILQIDPVRIEQVQADMTIVGGVVVYDRSKAER